jgi:hypothetical protein
MRWSQKANGYGVGTNLGDQRALPINPAKSITLKVRSMVIRNEITSRLLSGGRILEQVLTVCSE